MDVRPKLVSLFLIASVCLLGFVSMSTWGAPTPTPGKVAISSEVEIRQGANVSYHFAQDAYLDKLEVWASYLELNSQFRLSTEVSTGHANITLSKYDVYDAMVWTADPGTAEPTVVFALSGLQNGVLYSVSVDGVLEYSLLADDAGTIQFSYGGPWSAHEFEAVIASGEIPEFSSSSLPALLACLTIVTVMSMLRRRR